MELDPKDFDIVNLLTKLKNSNAGYPSDMLALRRQKYTQRVAEIGVGLGISAGLLSTIKNSKSGALTPTIGGLLETVILLAIVAEAGAAAYIYRDEIAQVIQSYTMSSKVQEVTSPPEFSTPLPEMIATEPPENTETLLTTETPTGTAILAAVTNDNNNNDVSNQAVSTPAPNGNNGNHFGQTPRPDRRDNGNNDERGNGNDK